MLAIVSVTVAWEFYRLFDVKPTGNVPGMIVAAVMVLSAVDLCQSNHVPIVVFSLCTPGLMGRVVRGERVGTKISE